MRVEAVALVLEISLIWFSLLLFSMFAVYMHVNYTHGIDTKIMVLTSVVTIIGDFSRAIVIYGCGVVPKICKYPWMTAYDRETITIRKGGKEITIRRVIEHLKGRGGLS